MKVLRKIKCDTDSFMVGDQIKVGKYTATCQKVTKKGALFLLDQYLDDAYPMNSANTNNGGYEASKLRKIINSENILNIFSEIRDKMIPFKNGDLIRIPYAEEIFGKLNTFESSGKKQWKLMKNCRNRIAYRRGRVGEWGWLQNTLKSSESYFAIMSTSSNIDHSSAAVCAGVRPVFRLVSQQSKEVDRISVCESDKQHKPCEDTISRQAALELFTWTNTKEDVWQGIKNMPPATTQPDTAHWVFLNDCANSGYYCSKCHKKVSNERGSVLIKKMKFCPNCGVKMEGMRECSN